MVRHVFYHEFPNYEVDMFNIPNLKGLVNLFCGDDIKKFGNYLKRLKSEIKEIHLSIYSDEVFSLRIKIELYIGYGKWTTEKTIYYRGDVEKFHLVDNTDKLVETPQEIYNLFKKDIIDDLEIAIKKFGI